MKLEEKITKMESCRGANRPLELYRQLLDKYLPAHVNLDKIQVAGTNGKGSTVQWMSRLLQKNGFKVGVFTSPHLISHFERIRTNDEMIPASDWERIYDRWSKLFEEEKFTMFEMDLWMAVDYFIEQDVDMAIMEAGLGGRKDATTSLDYKATLVTSIGLDHMEYLGNTKEEIAAEKGGIFKENTLAITAESDRRCLSVLSSMARRNKTELHTISMQVRQSEYTYYIPYKSHYLKFDLLRLPKYQLKNFVLALQTLQALEISLDYFDVQDVLDEFLWPGRFHAICADPYILVDGAHNGQGIDALVDSLGVFNGDIFFSALKEKETQAMIESLRRLNCPITLVSFESNRLADLDSLSKKYNLNCIDMDTLLENLNTRDRSALVCGSLYFTAEVLKGFKRV
jgi:dihydrofolate synthase/folylpolyglutamate synthase